MAFISIWTIRCFTSSFQNWSAHYPVAEKGNSYRKLPESFWYEITAWVFLGVLIFMYFCPFLLVLKWSKMLKYNIEKKKYLSNPQGEIQPFHSVVVYTQAWNTHTCATRTYICTKWRDVRVRGLPLDRRPNNTFSLRPRHISTFGHWLSTSTYDVQGTHHQVLTSPGTIKL